MASDRTVAIGPLLLNTLFKVGCDPANLLSLFEELEDTKRPEKVHRISVLQLQGVFTRGRS